MSLPRLRYLGKTNVAGGAWCTSAGPPWGSSESPLSKGKLVGRGYLEMTGYASPLRL